MANHSPESLGPLPKFDSNAALQARSLKALNALLHRVNDLCLRDERTTDYGVDASLEIIHNGHPTNFRSQVQLKSSNTLLTNQDGSYSLSIAVTNLNYLLNGNSSIYILYLDDRDEFRYAWVIDERRRLDHEVPNWIEQQTVTIRFVSRLDDAAIRMIRNRILRDEVFRRNLNDMFARHSLSEHVCISIEPSTLLVQDGETAYKQLCTAGLTMVANGGAMAVQSMAGLLNPQRRAEPRIQLVAAYAEVHRGRFLSALGHIAEASIRQFELSLDDRQTLIELQDICEVQTGRITREEYIERQKNGGASAEGFVKTSRRLEVIRFAILGERDRTRRTQLLEDFRKSVREIANETSVSAAQKIEWQIYLAYADGFERILDVTQQMGLIAMRLQLDKPWAKSHGDDLRKAIDVLGKWIEEVLCLATEAKKLQNLILYAEALRTALIMRIQFLSALRFQSRVLRIGTGPTHTDLQHTKRDAETAIAAYERADHLEALLRTKLALAEVYELADDKDGAKKIAMEVMTVAEPMQLSELVGQARAFLDETTELLNMERRLHERRMVDRDFIAAGMNEDAVDSFAENARLASKLPMSRFPIIRRDIAAIRAIALERLHWCQYLVQTQDLFHSRSQATAYAIDPQRYCRCEKHNFESLQGNSDANAVIKHFKEVYCSDCSDRSPKVHG